MPGPSPDPDLIRRWQRGDRSAFEALVREWEPRIGRFLVRMTGCPETARDLTQEVFLRVHLSAARYRDDGRFTTWLFQIAVNLARDAARRRVHRNHAPLPVSEPPGNEASAESWVEAAERADAVAAALSELSGPLREVVILRHYEDLSFEAMARMLDVPATTLKSRFTVAMRQLQERLSGFK